LQNDDRKLEDFIKDKYELKKWAKKGKDPMTLLYEGKELKSQEESDEEDQDSEEDNTK
jgi:hypothetical protein